MSDPRENRPPHVGGRPDEKKEHNQMPMGGRPGGGPPGGRPGMPIEKPKDAKKTFHRLISYMKPFWFQLVIAILSIIIITAGNLVAIKMIGDTLDTHIANFDPAGLLRACLIMLAIYGMNSFLTWLQSYLMLWVGQEVVAKIRGELADKFQKLPLKYFDQNSAGDLMSRVTNDVDSISTSLNTSISQVFQSAISVISTLAFMLYLSIPLTIASVVCIPLMFFLTRFIAGKSRKFYKEKQDKLGRLNGHIEEYISGQKVVKVFCKEDDVKKEFAVLNDDLLGVGIKAEIFSGVIGPIMGTINNITYAIIVVTGGLMMIYGFPMTLGTISNFIIYAKQITRPINELANQINSMMSAFAGAERVFEVLDVEDEPEDVKDAVILKDIRGDVVLEGVNFAYEPGRPILKNINLYANAGQTIALVGPTGAGKTTIINLLTRFYDIESGKITIDGVDLYDLQKANLRSHIGIVLQDTYLFTSTIKENIRYGRLDATDAEIKEAAKLANAHEFIKHIPKGYDSVLADGGSNLSHGQRQMIAIARAILANPSILILDEATSSVDTQTEAKIQGAMNNLMKGRTNFVIAHRLSTIKDADLIAVINGGEIIERGTHNTLMEKQGFYYNLYSSQFDEDGHSNMKKIQGESE
ncbi:ABC transporter ATP-binding protein [Chakrabartyella piscis]|uniref:ABC transporter ATP-binding protein n=1 Tax=Chakrabartyella piscis TaxID=2918914 RepID=UPI00295899B9|nr:ABC transporter ATP-binding protein [Chakrabartyella piscis]